VRNVLINKVVWNTTPTVCASASYASSRLASLSDEISGETTKVLTASLGVHKTHTTVVHVDFLR